MPNIAKKPIPTKVHADYTQLVRTPVYLLASARISPEVQTDGCWRSAKVQTVLGKRMVRNQHTNHPNGTTILEETILN